MKAIKLIIGLSILLFSCNSKDEFEEIFDDCLTSKQIELILQLNTDFDNFILEKNSENSNDLRRAYSIMANSINTEGDYTNYGYNRDKLDKIRQQLIDSELFYELNNVDSFRIDNENGNYLKCLESLSIQNKECNNVLQVINESGGRYSMNRGVYQLSEIAKSGKINSISKYLIVFEFIMVQLEQKTTANNMYN